jgi:hypothetical protein
MCDDHVTGHDDEDRHSVILGSGRQLGLVLGERATLIFISTFLWLSEPTGKKGSFFKGVNIRMAKFT